MFLYNCQNLKSVTLPNTITKFKVTRCPLLTFLTIPDNVEEIQSSAFEECSSLKSIVFHKNIKSIGDKAFYKCTSLILNTIPENIKKIGEYSFFGCKNIESITFESLTPPTLISNSFDGKYLKSIYVPAGSERDYRNKEGFWSWHYQIKTKP